MGGYPAELIALAGAVRRLGFRGGGGGFAFSALAFAGAAAGSGARRARRRTVIGGVEAGTFKHNSHRGVNLAQRLLVALRAAG